MKTTKPYKIATSFDARYTNIYFNEYEQSVAIEDAKNDVLFENVKVIVKENKQVSDEGNMRRTIH